MAAGDLITQDYQIEYDGVLLGQGDVDITKITGLLSSPEVRSNDNNRPLQDGVFPGNDYYGERVIVVDLEVWGQTPEEMTDNMQLVMAASAIRQRELPLVVRLAGWDEDLTIYARPRKRGGFDIVRDTVLGYVTKGSVMFVASNPRILSGTEKNEQTILFDSSIAEGLEFNATADFLFGAVVIDGGAVIPNNGSAPANVEFQISGPITDPSITATFPDGETRTLSFDITLAEDEVLFVKSDLKTVLLAQTPEAIALEGNQQRYNTLQDSSQWFDLPVGSTTITFEGTSTGSPSLVVAWCDTYL